MAPGHRRAPSVAVREAGSDADCGQSVRQPEALPGGGRGARRERRASAALHALQPLERLGAPTRGSAGTGIDFPAVVPQESHESVRAQMSSRDEILARVRQNQPEPRPLPSVPIFDVGLSTSINTFKRNPIRPGGKFVDPPADGNLDALIGKLFPDVRVVCSATSEVKGNLSIDKIRNPQELRS